MNKSVFGLLTAGLALVATGCAPNAIVGNGMVTGGQYGGSVGIVGHNNVVTVERGSIVPKLSIQGNSNTATVEDGAFVNRVEFWGRGNTVSLPFDLLIRATQLGANTIIRRARPAPPPEEYTPPPTGGVTPAPESLAPTTPPAGRGGRTPSGSAVTAPPRTAADEANPLPPTTPEERRP